MLKQIIVSALLLFTAMHSNADSIDETNTDQATLKENHVICNSVYFMRVMVSLAQQDNSEDAKPIFKQKRCTVIPDFVQVQVLGKISTYKHTYYKVTFSPPIEKQRQITGWVWEGSLIPGTGTEV